MIKQLPLTELPNLLRHAKEKEVQQAAYGMWLSHFTFAQLAGAEPMSFEEMLQGMQEDAPGGSGSIKSAEQIQSDAMAVVERYEKSTKRKGGDA